MTWLDVVVILLIVGYTAAGFFTGLVRRAIGLVALWVAFLGATNLGHQAGGILQQSSNMELPDARIYGFLGIVIAVLVIVEGAGQLAHSQIQIQAIALNRVTGVILGLLTGLLLSVVTTHELIAAGKPIGGSQLDALQARIHDTTTHGGIAVPLYQAIGTPIIDVFAPVLPGDPQLYFGPNVVQ
jgi:colicin V production protein